MQFQPMPAQTKNPTKREFAGSFRNDPVKFCSPDEEEHAEIYLSLSRSKHLTLHTNSINSTSHETNLAICTIFYQFSRECVVDTTSAEGSPHMMTKPRSEIFVSWDEIRSLCIHLAAEIIARGLHREKMLAITRGGLFPAGLLARELQHPAHRNHRHRHL